MNPVLNEVDHADVALFSGLDHYRDSVAVANLVKQSLTALALAASFVRPGDRVLLKPNWVKEHDERFPGPNRWEHVVTHPTVIEAVALWAAGQLQGHGSIVICDAPQTDSSFSRLNAYCNLDGMLERCGKAFPGIEFSLLDLRPEEWHAIDGVTVAKTRLAGDPQ